MSATPAPVRVRRVGGAVLDVEEPRAVWKKGHADRGECVIRMDVPPGEQIVYPVKPSGPWNNSKIRASAVVVKELKPLPGATVSDVAHSPHVKGFKYPVGERVEPDGFNANTQTTDGAGIHCFATPMGAKHWGRTRQEPTHDRESRDD